MSMFSAFDVSASALRAQRIRQTVIANNLANANTTRDPATGKPFRRKETVFKVGLPEKGMTDGVRVSDVVADQSDFQRIYNPNHPDADENGEVLMPNINVIIEMTDLISATRSYEANVTAMDAKKSMLSQAFRILA